MATKSFDLANLVSFGDVAAENDPVLDYFLKTEAVKEVQSNRVLLALGRKGSGKTALVRFFANQVGEHASRSLNLGGYPWNIHSLRIDHGAADIEAYVASWKFVISVQMALLAFGRTPSKTTPSAVSIRTFAEQNYGGINPSLGDLLAPERLKLEGTTLEPQIMGNKLGSITFSRTPNDLRLGKELDALSDALLRASAKVASESGVNSLQLHFDELDQGLTVFSESRKQMLVGLISAARAVRQSTRDAPVEMNAVIYLRTDLWDQLNFSDKNKITQGSSLTIEWDFESLLALINERLRARLGEGANWEEVTSSQNMRGSQTKWNHILGRTFLRPRDVIKFLNLTLAGAKKPG